MIKLMCMKYFQCVLKYYTHLEEKHSYDCSVESNQPHFLWIILLEEMPGGQPQVFRLQYLTDIFSKIKEVSLSHEGNVQWTLSFPWLFQCYCILLCHVEQNSFWLVLCHMWYYFEINFWELKEKRIQYFKCSCEKITVCVAMN